MRCRTLNGEASGLVPEVLHDTRAAVAVPLSALSLPLAVFVLTTFYRAVPDGLEAAARVEGTTRIGAFVRVIVPLSAPGVATAGVLTFLAVYTEYLFSSIMTSSRAANGAPMVQVLYGLRSADPTFAAAAAVLALAPVAFVVAFASDRVVSGLSASTGYRGRRDRER